MVKHLGKRLAPAKQGKLASILPETQALFGEGFGYQLPDEEAFNAAIRKARPELFEFTEKDQAALDSQADSLKGQ